MKCMWNRGWRSSHAFTLGVLWVPWLSHTTCTLSPSGTSASIFLRNKTNSASSCLPAVRAASCRPQRAVAARCSCRSSVRSTSRRGAPLVLLRCLHVLVPESQGDLPLRLHTDLVFHATSQTGPVPFVLISDEVPLTIHVLKKRESRRRTPHACDTMT